MSNQIQLAGGAIARADMGTTLIHEHIHIGVPGWQLDLKAPKYIRSEAMAHAVDRLQELRSHDCRTIIDPCPMDLGRDVEFVAEAAQKSGVNIIVATGVFSESDGIPFTFRTMPREDIVELYMKEITEGICDTGIKAGVIKIASGEDPANEYDRRMIGVAAEVSALSGLPIISHTHYATGGHEQVDVVEYHGGKADCMIVGHSGDRDDHAYQASIAKRGAFVGLDRFGLEMTLPDEDRMRNLIELVQAGYREQALISHDHILCMLGRLGPALPQMAPNWTLTHIFERIIPRLIELGLGRDDIDAILIDNPRRLFENAAGQQSV